jgi:hypothetical protein
MYTQAQPSGKSLMNYAPPPQGFKVANHALEEPAASSSTMNVAASSNKTLVTTYETGTQHCEFSLTYIVKLCAPTNGKTLPILSFQKCSDFLLIQQLFKWHPTHENQYQKVKVTNCDNTAQNKAWVTDTK